MVQSPIVSLLGPRNWLGWAIRYFILAGLVVGTVFAHDVMSDNQFHGYWPDYLGNMAMLGLPLYAISTGIMTDMGRLRKQLIIAAETDAMTGLLQRQGFIKAVNRRLSQAGTILMLDIDRLSDVNTKYDYHAGDLCLMALAIRLREVMRDTDFVGRVDGPKIAVFLPGTPLEDGSCVAKRLTEALQVTAGKLHFEVTVSIGVVRADGETPLAILLKDAETALMHAKARGPAEVMLSEEQEAA